MAARKSAPITLESPTTFDVVIVGAGLAGTAAAFHLSADRRVLLVDAGAVGSGATGVGAGIASPILARKGNPTHRAREALDALEALCDSIGFPQAEDRPLIRPAFDESQVDYYRRASKQHPDLANWISSDRVREQFPGVRASLGALEVYRGRVINLSRFSRSVAVASERRGCVLRENVSMTSWTEDSGQVVVEMKTQQGILETVRATMLILALGAGYRHFDLLAGLNLHPIKGQTLRAPRLPELDNLPNISGPGYLAFDGADIVLGSTFTHGVFDTKPTRAATDEIVSLIAPLVPDLQLVQDYEAKAAVRVTVPGTRLPMIGPITTSGRVWIFSGLGAKGLMMASLLTPTLADFIRNLDTIPKEMRPTNIRRSNPDVR